jgi:PAS domain-containing protein
MSRLLRPEERNPNGSYVSFLLQTRRETVMSDVYDPPSALVRELTALRQRVAQLEATEAERRPVDAELRREHAWLTSLLTTTQDAFLSIDRQGRIVRFNPAAERIFGYAAAEVHGQDLTLLQNFQVDATFSHQSRRAHSRPYGFHPARSPRS